MREIGVRGLISTNHGWVNRRSEKFVIHEPRDGVIETAVRYAPIVNMSYKVRDPAPLPPDRVKERLETTGRAAATAGFVVSWVVVWSAVGAAFTWLQLVRCVHDLKVTDGASELIRYFVFAVVWVFSVVAHAVLAFLLAAPAAMVRPRSRRWKVLGLCVAPEIVIGVITGSLGQPSAWGTIPVCILVTFSFSFALIVQAKNALNPTERV